MKDPKKNENLTESTRRLKKGVFKYFTSKEEDTANELWNRFSYFLVYGSEKQFKEAIISKLAEIDLKVRGKDPVNQEAERYLRLGTDDFKILPRGEFKDPINELANNLAGSGFSQEDYDLLIELQEKEPRTVAIYNLVTTFFRKGTKGGTSVSFMRPVLSKITDIISDSLSKMDIKDKIIPAGSYLVNQIVRDKGNDKPLIS